MNKGGSREMQLIIEHNMPETLSKKNVTLTRLKESHLIPLSKLAVEKRIWEHTPFPYFISEIFKRKWFETAMQQMQEGKRMPFVISVDEKIVGSSSYYEIDPENRKMKIGYTWLHPSQWGTKTNAISKFILLEYAFEKMKYDRVEFSVDMANKRACNALKKVGIKQEMILRNDKFIPHNIIRDSVIFSVIFEEWFTLKREFEEKMK